MIPAPAERVGVGEALQCDQGGDDQDGRQDSSLGHLSDDRDEDKEAEEQQPEPESPGQDDVCDV